MQPSELLLALEEKQIDVLDNQDVSDSLASGVQTMALFGQMDQNIVEGSFAQAMPSPSEDALAEIAMNNAFVDFTPPDDAPGLGQSRMNWMNIELGLLHDGNVMLVSDTPLPDIVRRVEYYREQRLFMVVYDDSEEEMMHYEVPENMANPIENTPNIMIYSLFPDHEPIGYKVPLVQVGNMI